MSFKQKVLNQHIFNIMNDVARLTENRTHPLKLCDWLKDGAFELQSPLCHESEQWASWDWLVGRKQCSRVEYRPAEEFSCYPLRYRLFVCESNNDEYVAN